MSKVKATRDQLVIDRYVAAALSHLASARFGQGDPGDTTHILAIDPKRTGKGNLKGRAEALCGATHGQAVIVRNGPGKGVTNCARCDKILKRIAIWIANQRPRDLFLEASGGG